MHKILKNIGLEVTHVDIIELNEEIIKAAKMYLGMEQLMNQHHANGIAIRSLVPWVKGMIDITPCMANMELNKQLKVGVCEGLVNSAITEMFCVYSFDCPNFIGDVVGIDRINDIVTFAHCQCPVNPHGTDRAPYTIRSHTLQKDNKMIPDDYPEAAQNPGAAVQVELPADEITTTVKFSIYDKKIAVGRGMSVSGEKFYKNFEDILYRTKLVFTTDSESFEKNYGNVVFGVHRNFISGDYKERIKDLARLIGFGVIEEDK